MHEAASCGGEGRRGKVGLGAVAVSGGDRGTERWAGLRTSVGRTEHVRGDHQVCEEPRYQESWRRDPPLLCAAQPLDFPTLLCAPPPGSLQRGNAAGRWRGSVAPHRSWRGTPDHAARPISSPAPSAPPPAGPPPPPPPHRAAPDSSPPAPDRLQPEGGGWRPGGGSCSCSGCGDRSGGNFGSGGGVGGAAAVVSAGRRQREWMVGADGPCGRRSP